MKRKFVKTTETKIEPIRKPWFSPEQWHVGIVYGLCAAGFLIYANTFKSPFHWDDLGGIVNNPAIQNPWDFSRLFDAFNTRVLTGWTFAVNYALGQWNVAGYHFFNIWLHVCNAVFVYALSQQILSLSQNKNFQNGLMRLQAAGGAALIFLFHPLATQPVNYIWQRSTLLMTFFYLLTLVLFLEFRIKRTGWMFPATIATTAAAMLGKESAFVLPVMVIVMDYLFGRPALWPEARQRISQWLCLIALMGIIPFLLVVRAEHVSVDLMRPYSLTRGVAEEVMPRSEYIQSQVNVLLTYVRLFIFPVGQNIDHDYPLVAQSGWGGWAVALLIHLGVLSSGIYFFKRNRLITWAVAWFYLNAALESFVPSKDLCVEHRMYLPMIGLCLGLSQAVVGLTGRQSWKIPVFIFGVIGIFLGTLTVQRNAVWQNDLSLWSDAAAKSPFKARPFNNRGQVLRKNGQIDPALNDFSRAIALDPGFAAAYQNRGHTFKMIGLLDRALDDYSAVIRLEPQNAQAYASRGNIYKRKEDFAAALEDYSTAVRLDPDNAEFYTNRAYLWEMTGQENEALTDYAQALKMEPNYFYAFGNRGNLNVKLKRYDQAVEDYTAAIAINPSFAQAYANRAAAYFFLGRLEEAKSDANQAAQLGQAVSEDFVRQLNEAWDKNIRQHP